MFYKGKSKPKKFEYFVSYTFVRPTEHGTGFCNIILDKPITSFEQLTEIKDNLEAKHEAKDAKYAILNYKELNRE